MSVKEAPAVAPFVFSPMQHQSVEFLDHRNDDARALLWTMRTGKTKSVIDLLCYRMEQKGDITGVLVVAPNGVHVNFTRRQWPLHVWPKSRERVKLAAYQSSEAHKPRHIADIDQVLGAEFGVLAVNSESIIFDKPFGVIKRFLKKHEGRLALIVDESHDFRTPGSKRSKRIRGLAQLAKVKRILTGTPVSNSPLAAWSQFEILTPGALGFATFGQFEAAYAIYRQAQLANGRCFKQLTGFRNLDDLQARIAQWASVVTREDIKDMPALVRDQRDIPLHPNIQTAYQDLKRDMLAEIDQGKVVTAAEGGVRLIRLQQMLSGWCVTEDGEIALLVPPDENARLQALLEDVRLYRKSIVWCKFREDIRAAKQALSAAGIQAVEYHGAISSQATRQQAIDRFNDPDSGVQVFLGQPRAGGSGLDLSAAEAVIWFSHTFDLIERNQANERATKIGGKAITLIDYVATGTVDEKILAALDNKQNVANELAGEGLRNFLLGV